MSVLWSVLLANHNLLLSVIADAAGGEREGRRAAQEPRAGEGEPLITASCSEVEVISVLSIGSLCPAFPQDTQMQNMRQQYEYWLKKKNQELETFFKEFNE